MHKFPISRDTHDVNTLSITVLALERAYFSRWDQPLRNSLFSAVYEKYGFYFRSHTS